MRLRPGVKIVRTIAATREDPVELVIYRPAGWIPWLVDVYYDVRRAVRRAVR